MFKQKVEVNHNGKWHTVTPIDIILDESDRIYFKMSDLSLPAPAAPAPAVAQPYGMVRPVGLMMVEADSPNVKISKITYGVIDNDGDLVDFCPDAEELERRYEQLYTKTDGYHLVEITKI